MIKKIKELLSKLFKRGVYYVGSSDILPEPLSKEEEEETLELASFGDEIAKNKLIEHNLRLVVFLAKKYENTNIDLEDLVSIGTIGLIKGINTYKMGKKIVVATYKPKKNEKRKMGHRQPYTKVEISAINA